jgi:hypothetical protein
MQNLMLAVVSVIKSHKINEDKPVRGLSRRRSSTRKFACHYHSGTAVWMRKLWAWVMGQAKQVTAAETPRTQAS